MMVIISDIHFDDNETKLKIIINALDEVIDFIKNKNYENNNLIDFIVIAGDYFEKRLNSDSKAFKIGIKYLLTLRKLTKNLIVLKGTPSHDANTLEILNSFGFNNIFYIDKFQTKLIDNVKFLFIPEEYPENFESYYSNLFNGKIKADIVIGHGLLKNAKLHPNFKTNQLKEIIFNSNEIEKKTNCKYNIWGHIHIPQQISNKTYYVGSLARYQFGETEDKRFIYIDKNWKLSSITIKSNPLFIDLIVDENFDIEEYYEILKDKNIFIRIKTSLSNDSIILKNIIDNSVNPVKIEKITNNEFKEENFIKHLEILNINNIEEQYKYFLNQYLNSNSLTKKQKELLTSNKTEKILKEILFS